jgi:integrase
MGRTDYLKRRHNAWSVRVQIPKRLRKAAGGKREYVKALGTSDLNEAERRKHIHVAEFKRRIAQLEAHGEDPDAELFEKALWFKDAVQKNKGQKIYPYYNDPEVAEDMGDFYLSEALDEAKAVLEEHGDEKADRFMRVVKGEAHFIRDYYTLWLDETRPKPKQRDAHSKVIRDYLEWAGQGITVEETDRKKAGAYISHLMSARGLAPKTVERYRSSLSTLWTWLEEKGITENNPWSKHRSIRPTVRTKRKPLSDEQLVSLLSGCYDTATYRQVLADLLRLALVTGCRLEELCALKKADVLKPKDGYWLTITEGKTAAAAREVPIHPSVNHVLDRRQRGQGEYLFGEITAGAYGRRSHHVSKAYKRYREMVGVGERGQDFHALRGTFTSMMEGAGVPVHTIQLLIGHSRRGTMGTTAIYTRGERVDLRKVISRLRYSSRVMKLVAHAP